MAANIKIGQELQDLIRKLELQSPGIMSRALDSQLIPIVTTAKKDWPKKTGFSASILRLRVENESNKIVKYIEDNASYAGAVHPKDSEALSVDTLVFDPVAKALEPMLEAFARELART